MEFKLSALKGVNLVIFFRSRAKHSKSAVGENETVPFIPVHAFHACQRSVPESIIAFLESEDLEDAIRKSITLAGAGDTMACIAGGMRELSMAGYRLTSKKV